MTRVFYTALYTAIAALVVTQTMKRDDPSEFFDLVGPGRASAQSPSPAMPWNGDPAATQFNPSYQQMQSTGQMGAGMGVMAPAPVQTTARPQSWPSGQAVTWGPQAKPAAPGADGLPGISIAAMQDGAAAPAAVTRLPAADQPFANVGPAGPVAAPQAAPPNSTPASAARPVPAISTPSTPPQTPPQAPPSISPAMTGTEIESTKIIARVGTEFILAGEVLGPINDMLMRHADQIPSYKMEEVKQTLMKQGLEQVIQTKMVLSEVRRKVPEEAFKKFSEKIGQQFDEIEINKAMARSGAKTRAELDDQLRKTGSSLDRVKKAFVERNLAMSWVMQHCKDDEEITHQEMLDYYHAHHQLFENFAKARWEQILIRFSSFPNKAAAYQVIAEAGNRVMRGEAFGDVAKRISEGPTAATGGQHGWTMRGSLVSEVADHALFTLPVGQLSPILEDPRSFQIIRVLERKDAGRTPFAEVQSEIKRRIKHERTSRAMDKYLAELKQNVQVWTIFDGTPDAELVALEARNAEKVAAGPGLAPPTGGVPGNSAPPGQGANSGRQLR